MFLLNMYVGLMGLLYGLIAFWMIVLVESVFLSSTLAKNYINLRIIGVVALANFISSVFGILFSGASFLSDLTSNLRHPFLILIALFFTLVLELPINLLGLNSRFNKKDILKYSLIANLFSYTLIIIFILMFFK